MVITPDIALALWHRAIAAEIGIAVETSSSVQAVREILYKARRDAKDETLDTIVIVLPGPKPKELWLVKKTTELP